MDPCPSCDAEFPGFDGQECKCGYRRRRSRKKPTRVQQIVRRAVRTFGLEKRMHFHTIQGITVKVPSNLKLWEAARIVSGVNQYNHFGKLIVLTHGRTHPLEPACWHLSFSGNLFGVSL